MRKNFSTIMPHIFQYEGGYVDHPEDPGGATNMGITLRTLSGWRGHVVSKQDVKDLTKDEAEQIYKALYWDKVEGDTMPSGIDFVLMDGAVNSGPRASVRWVQRALRIEADGVIGPITRREIAQSSVDYLVPKALDERRKSVRSFRKYPVFGRGWENRINNVEHAVMELLRNG